MVLFDLSWRAISPNWRNVCAWEGEKGCILREKRESSRNEDLDKVFWEMGL